MTHKIPISQTVDDFQPWQVTQTNVKTIAATQQAFLILLSFLIILGML
jgi:hypothetical protein